MNNESESVPRGNRPAEELRSWIALSENEVALADLDAALRAERLAGRQECLTDVEWLLRNHYGWDNVAWASFQSDFSRFKVVEVGVAGHHDEGCIGPDAHVGYCIVRPSPEGAKPRCEHFGVFDPMILADGEQGVECAACREAFRIEPAYGEREAALPKEANASLEPPLDQWATEAAEQLQRLTDIIEGNGDARLVAPHGQTSNRPRQLLERLARLRGIE